MTIRVQLRGGLGNQLFQYAAGVSLSQDQETDLILDTSLLPMTTQTVTGVTRWPEQISTFRHQGKILHVGSNNAALSRFKQSISTRERQLGDLGLLKFSSKTIYAREGRDSVPEFNKLSKHARINAYCNSGDFFLGHTEQIRSEIQTPIEPSSWFEKESVLIKDVEPLILHVRWGDYLNLKHIYGEIHPKYYRNAINLLAEMVGSGREVWLSSDDIQGATEFLSGDIHIDRSVSPPQQSKAIEALNIMGQAAGLVAANSTFSWWAAFIGDSRSDFGAIFPRPLFASETHPEPKNWLLSSWIQIGR